MRTIAIINQKGGCGKTTTSINLAAVLAGKGYRVLLADMDPQSHCALGLSVPDDQVEHSIADLLQAAGHGAAVHAFGADPEQPPIRLRDVVWHVSRNLDLAPSTVALAALEPRLTIAADRDRRLGQVLHDAADDPQTRYDFCVIDCPPSIGLLTFNALRAADEAIIPVETGYFALQGAVKQARTIDVLIRRVGHHMRFSVLPTMYDVRTKLAREILSELKRHFKDQVLPVTIHFNAKLKEAASFGQPISEYDPTSRGMQDFDDLARWLLSNPPPQREPVATPEIHVGHANDLLHPPRTAHAAVHASPGGSADNPHAAPGRHRLGNLGNLTAPDAAATPALSRAAELVERARALSARTGSAKPTSRSGASGPTPAPIPHPTPPRPAMDTAAVETAPQDLAPAAPDPSRSPDPGATSPAPTPHIATTPAAETPRLTLQQKIRALYGVRRTAAGALFVQPADAGSHVAIAADFNGWDPEKTRLSFDDRLRIWQAAVELPRGRYRYRLVVDGRWVADPHNPRTELNAGGEAQSILDTTPSPSRTPTAPVG